jgi:hypothetical protein
LSKSKGVRSIGGSDMNKEQLFIEPTVLTDVKSDDIIMQDEVTIREYTLFLITIVDFWTSVTDNVC